MNLHSFSLSRLFLPTYFVHTLYVGKTLLELKSKGPYPISEREITFCCCLFTFSIKREIKHFCGVVASPTTAKKSTERVTHVRVVLTFSLSLQRWIRLDSVMHYSGD